MTGKVNPVGLEPHHDEPILITAELGLSKSGDVVMKGSNSKATGMLVAAVRPMARAKGITRPVILVLPRQLATARDISTAMEEQDLNRFKIHFTNFHVDGVAIEDAWCLDADSVVGLCRRHKWVLHVPRKPGWQWTVGWLIVRDGGMAIRCAFSAPPIQAKLDEVKEWLSKDRIQLLRQVRELGRIILDVYKDHNETDGAGYGWDAIRRIRKVLGPQKDLLEDAVVLARYLTRGQIAQLSRLEKSATRANRGR
jgi:hypothetical protein